MGFNMILSFFGCFNRQYVRLFTGTHFSRFLGQACIALKKGHFWALFELILALFRGNMVQKWSILSKFRLIDTSISILNNPPSHSPRGSF